MSVSALFLVYKDVRNASFKQWLLKTGFFRPCLQSAPNLLHLCYLTTQVQFEQASHRVILWRAFQNIHTLSVKMMWIFLITVLIGSASVFCDPIEYKYQKCCPEHQVRILFSKISIIAKLGKNTFQMLDIQTITCQDTTEDLSKIIVDPHVTNTSRIKLQSLDSFYLSLQVLKRERTISQEKKIG